MTEVIKKLKPDDLTLFVRTVQEVCPKAIKDVDAKRLQIKVDDMDKESFKKIMSLIATKVEPDEEIYMPPAKKFKYN